MANPEHLAKLGEGVEAWNQWRKNNVEVKPNLRHANFSDADLSGANFFEANLSQANFSGSNLSDSILIGANLFEAKLNQANLNRAAVTSAHLAGANLSGANLSGATFTGANLSGADLSSADFTGAILFAVQALFADFSQSIFTGAVIQDWHIGKTTRLDGVKCDYIFRQRDRAFNPTARLPADPNNIFAPGEFEQWAKVRESALETIDLTFTEGIDWKAFFVSFRELCQQCPNDEISIQGIERKGEAFIVRLEVPQEADKGAIETRVKQRYETQLQALEAQYEKQLRLQGTHLEDMRQVIEAERREKATLMRVFETMANNQQGPKYDMRGAQFSGGFAETVKGNQIGGTQHNYAAPEKQDLADAASEIQRLLKQLEETNPIATEAEQKAFVTAAIPATLRQRAVGALQSGGRAAVEELLDNPYVNVAIAVIEGWQGAE